MTASQMPYPSQGYQSPAPLRAPEGTDPNTVWIWLIVALPIVEMLATVPLLMSVGELYRRLFGAIDLSGASGSASMSSAVAQEMISASVGILGPMLWVTLLGYVLMGVGVLFAWLDWRELRRRGVPKPFHWAWGFFAFAGAGTLVTLIGRSVVVRRRTGRGLAPLWAGIVVYIVIFVASIVWTVAIVAAALGAITVR